MTGGYFSLTAGRNLEYHTERNAKEDERTVFSTLEEFLQKQVDMGVPGCELAVCRDSEIVFHSSVGFSDYEKTTPASKQDRYLLYSCTKPMTATAAMQCLERGLFSLDDPVAEYLPAYASAYLCKDGLRRPPKKPITIRHLLTMTAGLNYNCGTPALQDTVARAGDFMTTRQLAEALVQDSLDFEPGSRFQYSLCLDVLGAVIEVASGKRLADFFRENIWRPLGMKDTCFYQPNEPQPRLVALYCFDSEGKKLKPYTSVGVPLVFPAGVDSGGAGLVSSVSDYLKFAGALASGEQILSKPYIDLMRTPQLDSYHPEHRFGCTGGPDYGYGFGVRTRVRSDHGVPSSLGEFGWDGAAGADVLIDPEHKLSFFYATHILNWPAMLGPLHLQIRDLLYPTLGI